MGATYWSSREHSMNLSAEKQLQFFALFGELQAESHANAVRKGFWSSLNQTDDEMFPAKIALCHSELTEALEAHRKRGEKSEIGEELADVIIRVMDIAERLQIPLALHIISKHEHNLGRPFMHDNKRY